MPVLRETNCQARYQEMGKLSDKSTVLYAMSYRDALRARILRRLHWVPSEAMLADDLTKGMIHGSGLWEVMFRYAFWQPQSRPELPEDWVTWTQDGQVVRYRLGDLCKRFLKQDR